MNEETKLDSPLKLYQRAYALQFKEGKLDEACDMYRRLIEKFPESDVSAYASIQLQKVQASDVVAAIGRPRMSTSLLVTLFALNALLIACVVAAFVLANQSIRKEHDLDALLVQSLSKMWAGKQDQALDILQETKLAYPTNITAFMISSEIHRKNGDFLRARKEYEMFGRLLPKDTRPAAAIAQINREEDAFIKAQIEAKEKEKLKAIPEEVVQQVDKKTAARKEPAPPPRPGKPGQRKVKLVVPRDSIAYF